MNIMKKTLKSVIAKNAIKFIDSQVSEISTKGCILLLFDEPEMPNELIDEQEKQSNIKK